MKAWVPMLALALAAPVAGAQAYLNCNYAPGWQQTGLARQYTAENLYEYRDGAAEGYLSFGFVRMTGVSCKSGENTLDVDVSQMKDADAAYGMFAANSDNSQAVAKIGMGGQVLRQSASFAKGEYYVEIVEVAATPEADDSGTMRAFAAGIERQLRGRDTPPEALKWFPSDGLVSVRLIPESVLGLRELARGYVARYGQGQAFVVEETSAEGAQKALKEVRAKFDSAAPAAVGDEGFQATAKYLEGVCIFRKGKFLAGYANLPEPADAVGLAKALAPRIP